MDNIPEQHERVTYEHWYSPNKKVSHAAIVVERRPMRTRIALYRELDKRIIYKSVHAKTLLPRTEHAIIDEMYAREVKYFEEASIK